MFLGIEIGGTKLQVGVGAADGSPLVALDRFEVDARRGASGILAAVRDAARPLISRFPPQAVGIGFGGPVDPKSGLVVRSHHVEGWDNFPLAEWVNQQLGLPIAIANDADTAALAEARFGAGRGADPVLYVTVGTGIGGGLIKDGRIYRGHGVSAIELGHLRPNQSLDQPPQILEALAAGWGIAATARQRMAQALPQSNTAAQDLMQRCGGQVETLTTKLVAQAAAEGNSLAQEVLAGAWRALGWGIAQCITLISPQVIVIGGGVSLVGEQAFFEPVRRHVAEYVFPPLRDSYRIVPAQLGEEVVVHGALALAAGTT